MNLTVCDECGSAAMPGVVLRYEHPQPSGEPYTEDTLTLCGDCWRESLAIAREARGHLRASIDRILWPQEAEAEAAPAAAPSGDPSPAGAWPPGGVTLELGDRTIKPGESSVLLASAQSDFTLTAFYVFLRDRQPTATDFVIVQGTVHGSKFGVTPDGQVTPPLRVLTGQTIAIEVRNATNEEGTIDVIATGEP